MPGTYDYLGWITSGLVMANGGQYYNQDYGGEVYYDAPSTLGALTLLDDMVHRWHVMPEGVLDSNGATSAFFNGRAGMMILSTGALGFVRDGMKTPYRVAFLPKTAALCGADRRWLPDHAERPAGRPEESRLDADQMDDQPCQSPAAGAASPATSPRCAPPTTCRR